jgi:hypothetical protein
MLPSLRSNRGVSLTSNLKVGQPKGLALVFEDQYPDEPKTNTRETVTISKDKRIINRETGN